MLLADAHVTAIRKLLLPILPHVLFSPPGPPLPSNHPSPSLLAKLYLHVSTLYDSARAHLGVNAVEPASRKLFSKDKDSLDDVVEGEVIPELKRYLRKESILASGLARKWIGVDAGENGKGAKTGEALAWVKDAQARLQELEDGAVREKMKGLSFGKGSEKRKEERKARKGRLERELDDVGAWIKSYQRMNDTVSEMESCGMSVLTAPGIFPTCPPRVLLDDSVRTTDFHRQNTYPPAEQARPDTDRRRGGRRGGDIAACGRGLRGQGQLLLSIHFWGYTHVQVVSKHFRLPSLRLVPLRPLFTDLLNTSAPSHEARSDASRDELVNLTYRLDAPPLPHHSLCALPPLLHFSLEGADRASRLVDGRFEGFDVENERAGPAVLHVIGGVVEVLLEEDGTLREPLGPFPLGDLEDRGSVVWGQRGVGAVRLQGVKGGRGAVDGTISEGEQGTGPVQEKGGEYKEEPWEAIVTYA